jgi:hypothetical protein
MRLVARLSRLRFFECKNSLAGARSPQGHESGVILSEHIPGSEILFLVIRVILKVWNDRYF